MSDQFSYFNAKQITWIVKIVYNSEGEEKSDFLAGGFSIDGAAIHPEGGGLIMTCAHSFKRGLNYEIYVRRLDQDTFYPADVIKEKSEWNIFLLKVRGYSENIFRDFINNGDLHVGQPIYMIGSFLNFHASFINGMVVFPCDNGARVPLNGQICGEISQFEWYTQDTYRVMGDMMDRVNRNVYRLVFSRLPVIQFESNFSKSGAPIFHSTGEIVGMVIGPYCGNLMIGVHVSVLRKFVQDLKDQ
ncbi:uncharacterized protein LOC126654544 [Mercurialis annua]|uniref:uncharacterized protein LOC126654544 n=1 Tax=Mercurialis annua TaxID=3986 RepID=UPI002160EE5C|nr:uncharacterized protein LOC126654544 [Mercurialis annua]